MNRFISLSEETRTDLGLLLKDFCGWYLIVPCPTEFCVATLVKCIRTAEF